MNNGCCGVVCCMISMKNGCKMAIQFSFIYSRCKVAMNMCFSGGKFITSIRYFTLFLTALGNFTISGEIIYQKLSFKRLLISCTEFISKKNQSTKRSFEEWVKVLQHFTVEFKLNYAFFFSQQCLSYERKENFLPQQQKKR